MPAADQGVKKSKNRYSLIPRTLNFITHGDDILMIKGAPNKKLWANKYNGVGGHVEAREDIASSAKREILEETGLTVTNPELCGVVNISTGEQQGIVMFVFRAAAATREVIASDEGGLEWIPIADIASYPLVEDLQTIVPKALEADRPTRPFSALYTYNDADELVITFGVE